MALHPYLRGLVFIESVGNLRSCVSHGDANLIVATRQRLDGVDQDSVVRIPGQQCQVHSYSYRGLRACRSISRVSIPWLFDHNCPLLYTVYLEYIQQRPICRRGK